MRIVAAGLFTLLSASTALHAQSDAQPECKTTTSVTAGAVAGSEREWRRAAEVAGALPLSTLQRRPSAPLRESACLERIPGALRPWLTPEPADTSAVQIQVLPVRVQGFFNSAYPDDRSNGAVWAGRGLSTAISLGAKLTAGPLTVVVNPTLAWQQNQDFLTVDTVIRVGYSTYSYPSHRMDWPQRFGDKAYTTLDPGQTVIRLDAKGFEAGASTENLWWGPGQRNSILMGNNGPGFEHIFFGSSRPFGTPIGKFNIEAVWGRLRESAYFDTLTSNNRRMFSGISFSYEPRYLDGLQIGINRVFTFRPGDVSTIDYVTRLIQPPLKEYLRTADNPEGQSPDDQLASLFARWVLQKSQFEVYAEWAKADHNVDWWDLLNEPDHGQAYTLGFQKIVTSGSHWVRLNGELTHLNASTTFLSGRGHSNRIPYYTHAKVIQGYTNEGALLGAWIGPGANTQYLGADYLGKGMTLGGYVERTSREIDYYYQQYASFYHRHGHDAEFGAGLRGSIPFDKLAIAWRGGWDIRRNRNFLNLDFVHYDWLVEHNWSLELNAIAHPGEWRKKSR